MVVSATLQAHLDGGATTLCRAWLVRRRDGAAFGFTDHDRNLSFSGVSYKANTGLTAQALQQTTGLSVDNAEALGALNDSAVTETDLSAGRYDGAEVEVWLVNWSDVAARHLLFRGTIGEVESGGGAFRAELRGVAEDLNRPHGRAFHRLCGADLGDAACKVDLASPVYSAQIGVLEVIGQQELRLSGLTGYAAGWFERGRLEVLTGAAAGIGGFVKSDVTEGTERVVTLWEELRAPVSVGDIVRLQAGCDKRADTCKSKFGNFLNFRGFPHIPGEDWLTAYPKQSGQNTGGSRNT